MLADHGAYPLILLLLIAAIVAGVVLPAVWSTRPARRAAALAVLRELLRTLRPGTRYEPELGRRAAAAVIPGSRRGALRAQAARIPSSQLSTPLRNEQDLSPDRQTPAQQAQVPSRRRASGSAPPAASGTARPVR